MTPPCHCAGGAVQRYVEVSARRVRRATDFSRALACTRAASLPGGGTAEAEPGLVPLAELSVLAFAAGRGWWERDNVDEAPAAAAEEGAAAGGAAERADVEDVDIVGEWTEEEAEAVEADDTVVALPIAA